MPIKNDLNKYWKEGKIIKWLNSKVPPLSIGGFARKNLSVTVTLIFNSATCTLCVNSFVADITLVFLLSLFFSSYLSSFFPFSPFFLSSFSPFPSPFEGPKKTPLGAPGAPRVGGPYILYRVYSPGNGPVGYGL